MNILFVADDFPPYSKGGAGISTSLIVKHMSKKHRCYVFTMKSKEAFYLFNKIPVFSVLYKAESQNRNTVEILLFGIKIIMKIIHDTIIILNFIRNNKIDLINIIATNYFSALQIIALSLLGKPVVVDVRDLYLFHTLSYLGKFRSHQPKKTITRKILFKSFIFIETIIFQLETRILKLMTKSGLFKIQYIALSNYIKNELIIHGYPKNRIKVIYNISESKTKAESFYHRENQIIYAGRIESEKGIWTAIKSWELVDEPLFRLVFIGEGSSLIELKEYVKNRQLNNVDFLGKISNEEVIKKYRKSKIIIAPSIWPEAFGRFIQESITSSTPLISTKVGGIPEGVRHRVTGLLIDPNAPKQLADAIKELITNKKLYERIVNNLEQESERYNPKKIINERLEIYRHYIKVK